jgi:hypothetical protein
VEISTPSSITGTPGTRVAVMGGVYGVCYCSVTTYS